MSKNRKYRLSALAKQDLLDIFEFTVVNWGESQARCYAQRLSDGFDLLAESPEIGKERDDLHINAMCFTIGSHVVFYSIKKDINKQIEISRVLHQAMDYGSHI